MLNSHYLDRGIVIQNLEKHTIKLIQHFACVVECINIVARCLLKITKKSMAVIILGGFALTKLTGGLGSFSINVAYMR